MKNGLIVNEWGNKFYYLNDKVHREGNLPAIEYSNGDKCYYLHGELHREDGPAFELVNGYKEYYINGNKFFYEEHYWKEIKKRKSLNYILLNLKAIK